MKIPVINADQTQEQTCQTQSDEGRYPQGPPVTNRASPGGAVPPPRGAAPPAYQETSTYQNSKEDTKWSAYTA